MVNPKREFKGDPIDMTGNTIGDENGETVDVVEDEENPVNFSFLPDEVDASDLSERDARIIESAVQNKDSSLRDLSDKFETNHSVIGNALKKHCPEWYEDVFKANGDSKQGKSVEKEEVLEFVVDEGKVSSGTVANEFGIARSNANQQLNSLERDGLLEPEYGVEGFKDQEKVYSPVEEDGTDSDPTHDSQNGSDGGLEEVFGEPAIVPDRQAQTIEKIESVCNHVVKIDSDGADLAESILEIIEEE